ncbi:hypothetical protein BDP27DRAFT_1376596 [Rhodocollybia butyracea]|uniref:Uncharacterized protein n=1 Tax=Rhodocollybia butyracea TaxID=206335 RepID=A0A9P5P534_9AGAR|nr:hypothetical protein BDP27DRAFT_1376596 [Rhodocollybia butyracea]
MILSTRRPINFLCFTIFNCGIQCAKLSAPSSTTLTGEVSATWSLEPSDPTNFVLLLIKDGPAGETTQDSVAVNSLGEATGAVVLIPPATVTGFFRIEMETAEEPSVASTSRFFIANNDSHSVSPPKISGNSQSSETTSTPRLFSSSMIDHTTSTSEIPSHTSITPSATALTSKKQVPIASIGGVIGGIAFCWIAFLAFFCHRRWKRRDTACKSP